MNLLDYIDWRGDLDFKREPFNLVDNLIFTQLSYLDLDEIVPYETDKYILLKDAWKKYNEKGRTPTGLIVPLGIAEMFSKMAFSKRYSDLRLFAYIERSDARTEKQFAAISIRVDRNIYIAFRGTDDSIIGWKEDFKLAFSDNIPAQLEASDYVDKVMKAQKFSSFYIGGHSKGGNLAIFSAMNCKKRYLPRIKRIFCNDGPGFLEKVIANRRYYEIEDKILKIVPEGSIIGQLLHHGRVEEVVVKSESSVIRQHDPFTWEVMGNGFLTVESRNDKSMVIDEVINSWLSEMSASDREKFTEELYELFTVSDAKTLKEISENKFKFFKALGTLKKETKIDLHRSLGRILEHAARAIIKNK